MPPWSESTYLCISDAEELIPRHSSSMVPASATNTRNLVLVRKTHIALEGGSDDLADFQLMPPLGMIILEDVMDVEEGR